MGAGLLAKAPCQSPNVSTDTPLSRASPLPHLDRIAYKKPGVHTDERRAFYYLWINQASNSAQRSTSTSSSWFNVSSEAMTLAVSAAGRR
ncbi:hypothetical protein EJJ20_32695 [Pseudomonas poae]|nr:hypothetical protein EJJ20_32695 [Pseudomonas poae]